MAGYKTWAVGEEVLAADFNGYTQSQVVARFPSASARTAQLPAPAVNQLSTLDTVKGVVDQWNGSAWAPLGTSYIRHIAGAVGSVQTPTPSDQLFSSFVMPFAGDVLLQLVTTWWGSAPGGATPCSALVNLAGTTSPAAASPQQFVGPTLPAQTYNASFPALYRWDDVAAGATVTIRLAYSTNAAQLVLAHHCGVITVLPNLF